jgi:hypothetical protein
LHLSCLRAAQKKLLTYWFLLVTTSRLDRVMETQGEELITLRAAHTSFFQLVAVKDQLSASKNAQLSTVIASKDEVIASENELLTNRTAELQRCNELLPATSEPLAAATDSSKRQCLHSSSNVEAPLDRDDILDDVFSFVGGGDHLYTGGVCRRWRGRYMQYCAQNCLYKQRKKLVTRHRSAMITESRLQLALSSGLTLKNWTCDSVIHTALICKRSLEPEKVMALLRVHGVPWSTMLCIGAASFNKLALLKWLHAHSCPWKADHVLRLASMGGNLAMLEWLLTVTAPWSPDLKLNMLVDAGCDNQFAVMKWLKDQGAVWPTAFSWPIVNTGGTFQECWDVIAVRWALSCGSGWLQWKCDDYAADKYKVELKQKATKLLEWAHANGCPCTCGHVQQQQQQEQQQQEQQ